MNRFLIVLSLASVALPAMAQARIAITGGRVVTNNGAPIEGGVVLMNDGVVVGVGPAGTAVPANFRVVDASGKWVTPGIIAGISQIGTSEVNGEDSANDNSARQSAIRRRLLETLGGERRTARAAG